MSRRAAARSRTATIEAPSARVSESAGVDFSDVALELDFRERPTPPAAAPEPKTGASIKESIIRWLEQQV